MAHWIAAVGALLAVLGSGMRAWFSFTEYEDLLKRTEAGKLVKWSFIVPLSGPYGLFKLPSLIRMELATARHVKEILAEGGDNARRLSELFNQFMAWYLVLMGAFLGLLASVIKAISSL
ncbi:hypothetical protein [Streptomyces sp. NBC_00162]|uniref:hypothetical protein n=1 Tax=Streptomyces sp. NBC_00162 TaxID=2903629 RepID=UPI00214BF8FE|nr:hypothetical protein [Streptomyces sp. NBC_00162]UUU38042.1 hypothetical protein JIW86_03720 [Streptomyces sp. NBC_00162]